MTKNSFVAEVTGNLQQYLEKEGGDEVDFFACR